ncbi:hypothetical protein [Pedobacter sp. Leaf170]|uniref:hypothetical protein n=1 Tax=Pedobacter sp. Leaf170 TaxID=2876558 RepID=UPI001E65C88B|nr:hypothetical protein [Pedobacter sp. Leaf170]
MHLRTFDIFTKKVDQYYNELVEKIDFAVNGITHNAMSTEAVQALQLKIFNDLYKFPELILGAETKNDKTEELQINNARSLFPERFTFSMSSSTSTVTEIKYKVGFNGDRNSLLLTEKYNPRSLRGVLEANSFTLEYHFQGSDFDANGPAIKSQKENLLNLLKENNDDVKLFFENKKQAFLNQIKFKIENKLQANQTKIDNSHKY